MTTAVPDILARIVEQKRVELRAEKDFLPVLEKEADAAISDRRDFAAALKTPGPSIISEIKKASPSKGVLIQDFAPPRIARDYEKGGAAALSVLTDRKFFQGTFADLQLARAAVSLPVIRKDFTIDSFHVVEAAAHYADAILLIAAILSEREMRDFREHAARYKMASLVEVHDENELQAAIASGAEIIGVNNRNLHTFEVRLETSLELADKIPAGVMRVAESGITTSADIRRLAAAGYDAFLVGEHLMRSGDPASALRELLA
jgi:indole-3-glycerol phosphate synthase